MRRLIVYGFAVLAILYILYGVIDDILTGSAIHYDFHLTSFACFSIFFIVLKLALRVSKNSLTFFPLYCYNIVYNICDEAE